jgi:uncharacterized protein HemY
MIMEWQELIDFLTKQLLIFVVFLSGIVIGYMYGRKDGGDF